MTHLIASSAAVGYITFVIVYAGVARPLRTSLARLAMSPESRTRRLGDYLYELASCPFCTGFWVAFGFVATMRFDLFDRGTVGELATVLALALLGGSAAWAAGAMLNHGRER